MAQIHCTLEDARNSFMSSGSIE